MLRGEGRTARWDKWLGFGGLIVTSAVCVALIAATARRWTVTGALYDFVDDKRATTQLAVQLLSSLLGLIHVSAVCQLVNYGARLRLARDPSVRLRTLQAWAALSVPRLDFGVPAAYVLPMLAASALGIASSSLWAGALTPVGGSVAGPRPVAVPSYRNTSLIREYPSEINGTGPTLSTRQGLFTYSVGIKHLGALMASAASATTSDGSARKHGKLDNTQFAYVGRSFGAGAPVGLTDAAITGLRRAERYSYPEPGYRARVACAYNASSGFLIHGEVDPRIWEVGGELPDSVGGPESSEYVGHTAATIVAMGVAFSGASPRRYVALAAGAGYAPLDRVQCAVDFAPTLFNVSVGIAARNISVAPAGPVDDFDPGRNLTRTLMRQFELISNDLTNLYVSTVGDALMASVAAVQAAAAAAANGSAVSAAEATLAGVENALTAMADDMLAGYAGAQLMVGRLSDVVQGEVTMAVFVVGQPSYVAAVSAVNLVIVLACLAEVARTRGWRALPALDIADPRWLVTASFRGGSLARRAAGDFRGWGERVKLMDGEAVVSEKGGGDWGDAMVQLRNVSADDDDVALVLSRARVVEA